MSKQRDQIICLTHGYIYIIVLSSTKQCIVLYKNINTNNFQMYQYQMDIFE